MGQIHWLKGLPLICGIIIGVAAACCVVYKFRRKGHEETRSEINSFSFLVRNQACFDLLDGEELLGWFWRNASAAKGGAMFFLARPTKKTAEMFALTDLPADIDIHHNLIQVVVDREKKLPAAVRLVTFSVVPQKIDRRLETDDFLIITDDMAKELL